MMAPTMFLRALAALSDVLQEEQLSRVDDGTIT